MTNKFSDINGNEWYDEDLARRETRLHQMYKNRALLEFVHSKEWFYKQVRAIHYDYGWPGFCEREPGPNAEPWRVEIYKHQKWASQPEHHIMCWEVDNDYFDENNCIDIPKLT